MALSLLLSGCALQGSSVTILSEWASFTGVGGGNRQDPHAGMDFGGDPGSPVIAAADGRVHAVHGSVTRSRGCGLGVTLYHPSLKRWTVYCHLSRSAVKDSPVKRGEIIGDIGTSGSSRDIPHVHFEVVSDGISHRDGDLANTEDPALFFVGCFDEKKVYRTDQLSYPVPCQD